MVSRVYIHASGRVQGVCFRDFTRRWALSFGLRGWVRNLDDGRVEICVEGEKDQLKLLIGKISEGPSYARVDDLDLSWENPTDEFTDFRITY